MTVVVLALDALDARLVDRFQPATEPLTLSGGQEIETYAHSKETPFTPEVWATVATGLGPTDHGVTRSGTSEWDNPVLELGSKLTGLLPESTRGTLGKLVRSTTGERERIGRTDAETVFDADDRVVRNWPGVTDGSDLQRAWDLMNAAAEGLPRPAFERELFGLAAQQFAWAAEMCRHDLAVAGVHVHTADAAGHAYADDEAALRRVYERLADWVASVRNALGPDDELLVVSDHGMRTTFLSGDDPDRAATHSFRAYASTTTTDVPEDVSAVRAWIRRHAADAATAEGTVDISKQRLRDLGYVE